MINNPLTNQNYINKDFQTIYPELLDLVKKLTYKWDPTISNESDPGVLLIKLNAILADKNNYNIDKNILECFPDTVTQHDNAYKMYNQLGYNMHGYISAKGHITFTWNDDILYSNEETQEVQDVVIPQFTMISNDTKDIVYTTLQECVLLTNGEIREIPCIQGVVQDLTFGSSTLIKPYMLDHKNRLYFPLSNVAENGIFVSDANRNAAGDLEFTWRDSNDSVNTQWVCVNNLYTQPTDKKCYKFGIDTNNTCYIEFPENVTNLMGEGILIKYIQSDGAAGNIASGIINSFYTDCEYTPPGTQTKIPVSKSTTVKNYQSITNGLDIEDIDSAYINYQRVVGTFDTLVTLRDYLNYIVKDEFEQVSNGVISDRKSDIQSSYKIVNTHNDITTIKPIVVKDSQGNPEMSAFALKTYFLEYVPWPKFTSNTDVMSQKDSFLKTYNKSFDLKLSNDSGKNQRGKNQLSTSTALIDLYSNVKSIEHDFIDKLTGIDRPLLFKNKFKLNISIIPTTVVTQTQANDIEKNVYEALLKKLSSNNILFGNEISYETVYDICNNADNRIKAIALDSFEYTPYAVVYLTEDDVYELKNNSLILKADGETYEPKVGINEIPVATKILLSNSQKITENEKLAITILAKNALAGTTPLYIEDDRFKYGIDQIPEGDMPIKVKSITTSNNIEFKGTYDNSNWSYALDKTDPNNPKQDVDKSMMLSNESIVFYAPNLITKEEYAASIKYVYLTDTNYVGDDIDHIPSNVDYKLKKGQYLFMFWKDEDSKDAPYNYKMYKAGTILKAGTKLLALKHRDEESNSTTNEIAEDIKSKLLNSGYEGEGQILGELNGLLYNLRTILSASKTVLIKEVASTRLDQNDNNYCYWITNDIVDDKFNIDFKYVEPTELDIMESYQDNYIYVSNFTLNAEQASTRLGYKLTDKNIIHIFKPKIKKVHYRLENQMNHNIYTASSLVTDYQHITTIDANMLGSGVPGEPYHIRCSGPIINTNTENYIVTYYMDLTDAMTKAKIDNADTFISSITEFTYRDKIKLTGNIAEGEESSINSLQSTINNKYHISLDINHYTLYHKINEWVTDGNSFGTLTWGTITNTSLDKPQIVNYNKLAEILNDLMECKLTGGYKIDLVKEPYISDDSATSTFEYLVKPNEYFFTSSDPNTWFSQKGEGTKILLEIPNSELGKDAFEDGKLNKAYKIQSFKVPMIDLDAIAEKGKDALKSSIWYNFKKSNNRIITVVENQILHLGEGTKIRLKQNPIILNRLVLNTDGDKKYQTETSYNKRMDSIRITKDGIEFKEKGTSDWFTEKNILKSFTFQYMAPEATSWTPLPTAIDAELGWDGYTILNINSGPDKPQRIERAHEHKVIIETPEFEVDENGDFKIDEDGNKIYITYAYPPENSSIEDNYTFQLSSNITKSGGDKVDLTGENGEDETVYMDAYIYTTQNICTDNDEYKITKENNVYIVDLNTQYAVNTNNSLTIKIPIIDGCEHVILPIEFIDDVNINNYVKFNILQRYKTYSGETVDEILTPLGHVHSPSLGIYQVNPNNLSNIESLISIPGGIYYFKINSSNITNKNESNTSNYKYYVENGYAIITIEYSAIDGKEITGDAPPITFRLNPLFVSKEFNCGVSDDNLKNYGVNDLITYKRSIEPYILNKIQELDESNIFNYIYKPITDVEVPHVLESKSYFKQAHIANKFTIPQILDIKIQTLNKRS